MDKINPNSIITREELLNESKIGIYKVTDSPITGYKIANYYPKNQEERKQLHRTCILELEIPIGALIVRAYENCDPLLYRNQKISNKLRTDKLVIKNMEHHGYLGKPNQVTYMSNIDNLNGAKKQLSLKDNTCRSYWYEYYEYTEQEMYPTRPLSLSLFDNCDSGLHFFLHKEEAENYFK